MLYHIDWVVTFKIKPLHVRVYKLRKKNKGKTKCHKLVLFFLCGVSEKGAGVSSLTAHGDEKE